MHDARAAARARQDIVRLAHTRADSFTLRQAVAERMRRWVDFDAYCWWTTDPATMFLTTSVAEWEKFPSASCLQIHRNEYLEQDFNKFRDLARAKEPAALLARATEGHPERSNRYQQLMWPDRMTAELRSAQTVDGACWGALALYRAADRPGFDEHDVRLLADLAPHLAHGLRTALLADAIEGAAGPDTSGLIILGPEGRVAAVTAGAARWLRHLRDAVGGRLPEHRLSDAIYAVASVARGLNEGPGPARLPRARVRVETGEWLLVHAARLERDGDATDEVAVMIEQARPTQIAPVLVRAYGLSQRETDVVKAVLHGLSTEEIAHSLHLSPYTVQDYLKSVFHKVGVSSRRELVAHVFTEQHWPQYGDGEAALTADGWYQQPTEPA
ncbi:helix-turn-helix transcriptional regulator [Geodermatophilus sabuli]|uniref:GAF domain-containing protein n=1 Tax=Geodermatophilus sabuli TaxID=1564158 RepID=A0A285ED81_9ACTN|nr:helix-turn-helix transcriptional regulator [Geodermatophilus sabuli]MBB3083294.1 DNA-binding CsgD family transcriptional regulator [Geodermatophilus sabuli]SNX96985.1 GAF domain-containing protein [Geodermatophilus sabuli]